MRKVLLVSALAQSLNHLKTGLTNIGYEVTVATTSARVWQTVVRHPLDAIVLNASRSTAELEPWLLVSELSSLDHLTLIVLTPAAHKQDRVRAFQAGARHCLTLPASAAELSACLNAILLSRPEQTLRATERPAGDYVDAEVQIDFANRQIRRKGKRFSLTARESPLLQHLVQNAGKMIPSAELCRCVWGPAAWPKKRNLLKTYIAQLRRKLERDVRRPRYLISRRGLGYGFMPPAA